jgi:hypothetical protein
MVIGQYYRGKWRIRIKWHPDCWIEQGIEALSKTPVIENRGRQRMSLSDEDREKRLKILRRRASVLQRIKKEMENNNVDKQIKLGCMLGKLREEIEPYGGIPESW